MWYIYTSHIVKKLEWFALILEVTLFSVFNWNYNGAKLRKPKIPIFVSKIGFYELISNPYIEENQIKPVCFLEKIESQEKNEN